MIIKTVLITSISILLMLPRFFLEQPIMMKKAVKKAKLPFMERDFLLYTPRPLKNLWIRAYLGTADKYVQ